MARTLASSRTPTRSPGVLTKIRPRPHCRVQTAGEVTGRCHGSRKSVPAADLVDLGDSHGDGEVIGESVLTDRLPHSTEWDWLRVDTWIDHRWQFEDLNGGWIGLDRGVAGGHVLVDQEPRLGGAPRDLAPRMSLDLIRLLAAKQWHEALLRFWCFVATPSPP
jgi:hypothetical protein